MDDLITRLQAAPEGSRELSDEVLLAMGWTQDGRWWFRPGQQGPISKLPPDPTRSLDDAVAMVPEGWWLEHLTQLPEGGGWAVQLRRTQPVDITYTGQYVPTPALALCIAVLKAQEKPHA